MSPVNDGMSGGGVDLGFDVVKVWALNGKADAQVDVQAGSKPAAVWFGGWGMDPEELEPLAEQYGISLPKSLVKIQRVNPKKQTLYDALVTRSICFAPAAKREGWFDRDARAIYPQYAEGRRMVVNVLGYLAIKAKNGENGVKFVPFVPAMLTAKGWQAGYVKDALFKGWKAKTASARGKAGAPYNVSPWYFWMDLGTFGDKPVFITKGKGEDSHALTPLSIALPDKPTPEYVIARYVGPEIVERLDQMADMAKDWRDEWNAPAAANGEVAAAENGNGHDEVKPIPVGGAASAAGAKTPSPWDDDEGM